MACETATKLYYLLIWSIIFGSHKGCPVIALHFGALDDCSSQMREIHKARPMEVHQFGSRRSTLASATSQQGPGAKCILQAAPQSSTLGICTDHPFLIRPKRAPRAPRNSEQCHGESCQLDCCPVAASPRYGKPPPGTVMEASPSYRIDSCRHQAQRYDALPRHCYGRSMVIGPADCFVSVHISA
ncbi:uncharacterized protein B0T15DRAFT_244554 [Chaetomium strumarium]|uniref:Uncharacterized protein n=1 Tax=Chaetomium strumarium TaxID=1170767 RepID=A0AAJ0GRE5_9PEZI|nr:hypothetical protein B0T15DRAFT_244554 [Chaetomium strumarium]